MEREREREREGGGGSGPVKHKTHRHSRKSQTNPGPTGPSPQRHPGTPPPQPVDSLSLLAPPTCRCCHHAPAERVRRACARAFSIPLPLVSAPSLPTVQSMSERARGGERKRLRCGSLKYQHFFVWLFLFFFTDRGPGSGIIIYTTSLWNLSLFSMVPPAS